MQKILEDPTFQCTIYTTDMMLLLSGNLLNELRSAAQKYEASYLIDFIIINIFQVFRRFIIVLESFQYLIKNDLCEKLYRLIFAGVRSF